MVKRTLAEEPDDEALENAALPSVVEKDGVNLRQIGPILFFGAAVLGGGWMVLSGMQGGQTQPDYVDPGGDGFSTGMRGNDAGVYVPPFGLGREAPEPEPEPIEVVAPPPQPPRPDPLRGFAERQRLELERQRAEAEMARLAAEEAFRREQERERLRREAEDTRRRDEIMRQRRRAPSVVFDESEDEQW